MKNQRIASKLGNIDDFGAYPRRVDYAGADLKDINYDEKYKSEVKELETRYDSLGTDCKFRVINDYVNNQSFCCDNNEVEIFNRPDIESGNSEDAGIFFYHPDHLGSTAMVTDADGRITQNVVYIPFGEVFVEQRYGNWNTPYLFNAKELDEETGLYYYGARYLDPTGAQWLSVDPLFEKYAGMSPYNYSAGNPVKFFDPDGRIVWFAPVIEQIVSSCVLVYTAIYICKNKKTKKDHYKFQISPMPDVKKEKTEIIEKKETKSTESTQNAEHTKNARSSTKDKHTKHRSGATYGELRNNNRGDKNKIYSKPSNPNKKKR